MAISNFGQPVDEIKYLEGKTLFVPNGVTTIREVLTLHGDLTGVAINGFRFCECAVAVAGDIVTLVDKENSELQATVNLSRPPVDASTISPEELLVHFTEERDAARARLIYWLDFIAGFMSLPRIVVFDRTRQLPVEHLVNIAETTYNVLLPYFVTTYTKANTMAKFNKLNALVAYCYNKEAVLATVKPSGAMHELAGITSSFQSRIKALQDWLADPKETKYYQAITHNFQQSPEEYPAIQDGVSYNFRQGFIQRTEGYGFSADENARHLKVGDERIVVSGNATTYVLKFYKAGKLSDYSPAVLLRYVARLLVLDDQPIPVKATLDHIAALQQTPGVLRLPVDWICPATGFLYPDL